VIFSKDYFGQARRMVKQAENKDHPMALVVPAKMDILAAAELANVSIATVSRTFNRTSTVNPNLAKRVWAAIDKLDYFPNFQARVPGVCGCRGGAARNKPAADRLSPWRAPGVKHLAVSGHRKIAFISGPRYLHSAQSRQTAFIGALEECGIKSPPVDGGSGPHHGGR
jgi:hypothetical protein